MLATNTSLSTIAGKENVIPMEIIAVDQDHMGVAGRRVRDDGDLEVWERPLADGSRAVVLFNRSEKSADIAAFWPEIWLTRIWARPRDSV